MGHVYTGRQRQCCENSAVMLDILFSLKIMESLENGLQPDSGATYYRSQTKFAKVMFSQISVHGGGCLPHCMLGYTHPPGPEADNHPDQTHPSGADTSPGRHPPRPDPSPPGVDTPPRSACWEIRATSGRYASYWNAYFLF